MLIRIWRKGNPCALLVGMQLGGTTSESSMELPQKVENGTVLQPNNSTSGNLSEEIQNTNSKEYMHLYVRYSVIYNSQDLEAVKVSVDEWIKNYGTFTQWNTTQQSKRRKFTFCNKREGLGQHNTKRNKPVRG